jgi:hypothetical protein
MGMEAVWKQIEALAAELRRLLNDVPNVHVQDKGESLCGIVSFTVVRQLCCERSTALHACTREHG